MSDKDDAAKAAMLKAKALSRWEGEGGALGHSAVTLDSEDMRVLARLGAALLLEWAAIAPANREAIIRTAESLHAERDATRIRREIARLMDEHKGR